MGNIKGFFFINKLEKKLLRLFKGKKFFFTFAIADGKGGLDTRRFANDFPNSSFPHVKKEIDLFVKNALKEEVTK